MSFTGKVILITGASSGIGAGAARHLAKLGGKIALVGRNEQRLSEVEAQIKIDGSPTPLGIVADVTNDAERIIDETVKHFGKLDVLINNAGIIATDSAANFKLSEFDRVMATNLRSVVILTNLAVPHLEKTKGNIVNVSSVAGLRPERNLTTYCISKAALDQFTKCSSLDLAPKQIRVNSVNPASIRTPILESIGMNKEETKQHYDKWGKKYPLGRVGEVEDTSTAIAYLASDSASFLTGILLPVDGGSVAGGR